jgi:ubiquinol-cytochrome c reductase cytochrome c1 subunit
MLKVFILLVAAMASVHASEEALHPPQMQWPFDGIFGTVDRQAAQRGFQVYKEVCAACHGLHHLSYRNLAEIGFGPEEIKAIAAEHNVTDGPNDAGEMFDRSALPFDRFVAPFANEQAARAANNGAYPPDQSLIIKARPNGANYVYALLTGYGKEPPKGVEITEGMHYNPYFPGGKLAMTPPLIDGMVTYMDGTKATVDQMARDVVVFLQWVAEPEMEARKQMGIKTCIFLLVFTILFYLAKSRVWHRVKAGDIIE